MLRIAVTLANDTITSPSSGKTLCAQGSHNAVRLDFTFSAHWTGLTKRVVMLPNGASVPFEYPMLTDADGEYIMVTQDVTKGSSIMMSIKGGIVENDVLTVKLPSRDFMWMISQSIDDLGAIDPVLAADVLTSCQTATSASIAQTGLCEAATGAAGDIVATVQGSYEAAEAARNGLYQTAEAGRSADITAIKAGTGLNDGAVSPVKASFFDISKNIYNTVNDQIGYVVSSSGVLTANASYRTSEFIACNPGDVINFVAAGASDYKGVQFISGYSSADVFVGRVGYYDGIAHQYTIGAGVYKMRLSVGINTVDVMVNFGAALLDYSSFGNVKIKRENIYDQGYQKIKANFIGDSLIYGYLTDVTRMSTPIPDAIKNILGFNTARNYGVSGTALSNTAGFVNNPMCVRYTAMDNDANLIIVMGGTNDQQKNVALGTIDSADDTTFYGGLNRLIAGLIAKYPNGNIILCTPPHRTEYVNTNGNTMADFATAVRAIANKYSLIVFDAYGVLGLNSVNLSTRTVDGTHFTQDFVLRYFAPKLAKLITSNYLV